MKRVPGRFFFRKLNEKCLVFNLTAIKFFKVLNLDKSSLKPSLCKKAIDNVVEYTKTSSTMSESKSEDLDSGPKSEISSNKHNSANGSCVDSSTSCSTDDDCNSVNDSNTLKSSKTLKYKININNDLERYYLK